MAGELPLSVARWRSRGTRTNDVKKLNPEICPKILFEYVAREFREMGQLIELMPRDHKELVLQTYHFAMGKEKEVPKPHWNKWPLKDPYFLLPENGHFGHHGHFYRAAGPAVEFVVGEKTIASAISDAAQKTFGLLDWQTQLRMIQSVLAVENEFGKLDPESGDLLVANDWLKEHGMETLVFAESLEVTLALPPKEQILD